LCQVAAEPTKNIESPVFDKVTPLDLGKIQRRRSADVARKAEAHFRQYKLKF
jgi:hypothetical protein